MNNNVIWGKDQKGNAYSKCLRCGSSDKKYFSRGYCKPCYTYWLADNNPEFKLKLKLQKKVQKKRYNKLYRKTEVYRQKMCEKYRRKELTRKLRIEQERSEQVEKLKSKYLIAEKLLDQQNRYIKAKAEEEKKEFPELIKYIFWVKNNHGIHYNTPEEVSFREWGRIYRYKLLCVPYSTVYYLKDLLINRNYELLLGLVSKLNLTLSSEYIPNIYYHFEHSDSGKNNFANRNIVPILKRLNQKIALWEIENEKNFMNYVSKELDNRDLLYEALTKEEYKDVKTTYKTKLRSVGAKIEHNLNNVPYPFRVVNGSIRTVHPQALISWNGKEYYAIFFYKKNTPFREISKLLAESEDEIRFEMGIPAKGEAWVSEAELYHKVKELGQRYNLKVIHHAKPRWLGKQHIDIYIPKLKVAFEYQGGQHIKPVDFFGGEKGFVEIKKRDLRKKELCDRHKIHLIYIYADEEDEVIDKKISQIFIKSKIRYAK